MYTLSSNSFIKVALCWSFLRPVNVNWSLVEATKEHSATLAELKTY